MIGKFHRPKPSAEPNSFQWQGKSLIVEQNPQFAQKTTAKKSLEPSPSHLVVSSAAAAAQRAKTARICTVAAHLPRPAKGLA